ncbi:unnamed protein product [Laminaria digitata]
MQHVVTQPMAPLTLPSGHQVHQLPVWQDNLVWLIVDPQSKTAAAVDGPEAQPVLDYLQARGLRLTTIFNTHTHMDHVGINADLQRQDNLRDIRIYGPKGAQADVPGITDPVTEGDTVEFCGLSGRVLLTEGHINGHVSFVFGDLLFCGDTLFAGGCGYLFDGPPERMHDSLTRLAALPEQTRVCCAHEYTQDNLRFAWSVNNGNEALAQRIREVWALRNEGRSAVPSTIAEERATNPFLRTDDPQLLAHLQSAFPDRDLDEPGTVFAATRALKDLKRYKEGADPVQSLLAT